ncbi:MAG: hypothetical protein J6T06_14825, partial [Victivallales bacterium]|nr:hypothetical protein [Victivallales bacterium]
CAGCALFDRYKPVFNLSLHREVRRDAFAPETSLIQPVYDVMGRNEHFVSRFPIVDSSCFGEAELVHGENGKWGLRMKLDRKGIGLWRQATGEYGSQTMVILMDGYFCGTMMIPPYDESGYLMLPPLWSELEARRIASHVPSNYRKANR